MGHIFRLKKAGVVSTTGLIEGWNDADTTIYNHGYVDDIQDATITPKNEITSIPSPFARIELVKEAFAKVVPKDIDRLSVDEIVEKLHGTSIYHKMVSDSLDVGQIFFNFPVMSNQFEIIVWDKKKEIEALKESHCFQHKIVGQTLDMFFKQDALGDDPYNFGKLKNLYILRYKGKGQKPMHIIGATSPATLFFSTANDESAISNQICFGIDNAFDNSYASLDQRNPEFLKYLYTLSFSNIHFHEDYPEVSKYLDAVFRILSDDLKTQIEDIRQKCQTVQDGDSYLDTMYEVLTVKTDSKSSFNVEVNGCPLHLKKSYMDGTSDFQVASTKKSESLPLILPIDWNSNYEDLLYFGTPFGRNIEVPKLDKASLPQRLLPGINVQYPYLTICDFLEDKIVKLPAAINSDNYFDGNYSGFSGAAKGYLLPIKDEYFNYFSLEDLIGLSPSGNKTIELREVSGSGIEVTLRIPIQNRKEIVYKRIYNEDVQAVPEENIGAVVVPNEDLAIGVFPPVKFTDESDAFYRVILLTDNTLYKQCNCSFYSEKRGLFTTNYVVRNREIEEDLTSKVYILDHQVFDFARVTINSDKGVERIGSGLMIPKFRKQSRSGSFTFAIDFGTSNTHIEYITGPDSRPKPLEFDREHPQLSLLFKSESASVMDHLRAEFVPEALGSGEACHFPTRTVLCVDKQKGYNDTDTGNYEALGTAAPAFMYNQKQVGTKYNNYLTNLKWGNGLQEDQESVQYYIESLFLLIRAKVLELGGSISQTKIKWFYPVSMSTDRKNKFELKWINAYKKYFNPDGEPEVITESIAPYSFFQDDHQNITDIVTVDIGGGTTDIVVVDSSGVKCISSMRFAADAIFGTTLVRLKDSTLNGILRQCKNEFIDKLKGDKELQNMLITMTADNTGNSSEVASFLFSLVDNVRVKKQGYADQVDFNAYLMNNNSQKIVFFIFYTSIIYHLAHLMKAKGYDIPPHIAFSGNGSKVISVLSPNVKTLEKLTTRIFKLIYEVDTDKSIKLDLNLKNPKEATCKGGLLLKENKDRDGHKILDQDDLLKLTSILLNVSDGIISNNVKYETIRSKDFYAKVVEDVKDYVNFISITLLSDGYSLSKEFGIEKKYINLATQCFNQDLSVYVEKGVDLKLKNQDVSLDDTLEETLFFYPIIGIMNDLSDQICDSPRD